MRHILLKQHFVCIFSRIRFETLKIFRYIKPPGLVIAVLGVDGAGKSTVINAMLQVLNAATHNVVFVQHLRPGLFPPLARLKGINAVTVAPVLDPHSSKASGIFGSLFRLTYLTLDYILGYWIKIRPKIAKQPAVVIYDRYAHDMFLDPRRFRIALPNSLIKWFVQLAPRPDLIICLYAEPEVVVARKQELSLEETRRQIHELVQFAKQDSRAVRISTDGSLKDAKESALQAIYTFLTNRSQNLRGGGYSSMSQYLVDGKSYLALPSVKNGRWLFPAMPKAYVSAWNMYSPDSLNGKLFKEVCKGFAQLNCLIGKRVQVALAGERAISLQNKIREIFSRDDLLLAFSVGTPGPFQKTTAMILDSSGKIHGYLKIAQTELAIGRLKNEAETLKSLKAKLKDKAGVTFPKCFFAGEMLDDYLLIQSACPFKEKSVPERLNQNLIQILQGFSKEGDSKIKLIQSKFLDDLRPKAKQYPQQDRELILATMIYLEEKCGPCDLNFGLMHGDFAPWNMFFNGEEIFLFDWEAALLNAPTGLDAIHYLFQTNYLLRKRKGETLLRAVLNEYKELSASYQSAVSDEEMVLIYLLMKELDEGAHDPFATVSEERRRLIGFLIKEAS